MSFPLQLMHPYLKGEKAIIATLYEDHVEFKHNLLGRNLKAITTLGISIPFFMQGEFDNKSYVSPGEDLFVKAFVKAYFPFNLKPQGYALKECSLEGRQIGRLT